MPGLVVLVPVLNRPHRVTPLLKATRATTPDARILFITNSDDHKERRVIANTGSEELVIDGNYAAKIAAGVQATTEDLVFLGADDLVPQRGWLEEATAKLTDPVQVVGVNDLIDRPVRPTHATHFLMTREAAEMPCIDGSPGPLYLGYDHSACDDELIATATHRGIYAYAEDAHVRHLHPMNETATDDETYRLGRVNYWQDIRLFRRRSRMWR